MDDATGIPIGWMDDTMDGWIDGGMIMAEIMENLYNQQKLSADCSAPNPPYCTRECIAQYGCRNRNTRLHHPSIHPVDEWMNG